MNNKPEISVIMSNYNHGKYIKDAVESVLYQTFSDFEIIIVDDCSTDNSKEVINELVKLDKDRIREPIFLEQNKGKWFALNTALSQARGKIYTLLDVDDQAHSTRLERQLNVMKEFKSFMTMCCFHPCKTDMDFVDGKNWNAKQMLGYNVLDHQTVTANVLKYYRTPGYNHFCVDPQYHVHGASGLVHKSLWDFGLKYMPENQGLRIQYCEDGDFNTKITLLLQKTSVLLDPLYLYRVGTTTHKSWNMK